MSQALVIAVNSLLAITYSALEMNVDKHGISTPLLEIEEELASFRLSNAASFLSSKTQSYRPRLNPSSQHNFNIRSLTFL
jgi:hypothetical protein